MGLPQIRLNALTRVAAACLSFSLVPAVSAFGDTSPFFVVSSTDISLLSSTLDTSGTGGILTTKEFVAIAKNIIDPCTSDAYILVNQPGIHASDFKTRKCATPHMKRAMESGRGAGGGEARTQRTFQLPYGRYSGEMEGEITEVLEWYTREKCAAEMVEVDASTGTFQHFDDMKPKVVKVDFPEIKSSDAKVRAQALADADTFLFSIISLLPTDRWTLIYTSSPRSTMIQETEDEPKAILRRRADDEQLKKNSTAPVTTGSVFRRYQFFTPAIFMGYTAGFFVLVIAFVGLSSLTSLKVSYAAFEKEMGPAAARKQQ